MRLFLADGLHLVLVLTASALASEAADSKSFTNSMLFLPLQLQFDCLSMAEAVYEAEVVFETEAVFEAEAGDDEIIVATRNFMYEHTVVQHSISFCLYTNV